MTDFIIKTEEFLKYKARFNQFFINEDFGSNPFNSDFKHFLAFEFDFIYHELFFEGLKKFLSEIENQTVTFYTIDPRSCAISGAYRVVMKQKPQSFL